VESVYVTTANGTATYGTDYFAPVSQQVVFAPGQTMRTVSISTLRDAGRPLAEGNETFLIKATPVTAALGTRSAVATITDYVPPPLISVQDVAVAEGNSGTTSATFTVSLSSRYPRAVTVDYATRDLTATTAGQDYAAAVGTLTFAAGETSKTFSLTVNGDQLLESDERFQVVLSAPRNATLGRSVATCTIRNDEIDATGFQITLKFVDSPFGAVPSTVQQLARDAAQRWSRVIVGDVLGQTLPGGLFIDDFELTVQMGLLGDPDGTDPLTVANAAPTDYRSAAPFLPYTGITGLDPADVSGSLSSAMRFWVLDVITHELGHALGFGAGFRPFDPWVAGDTFVGPNAVQAYRQTFSNNADSVPLQAGVRGHWDENIFGTELMTPTATSPGTRMPISRVTIGALQDMGYTVNPAAADSFLPVRPGMGAGGSSSFPPIGKRVVGTAPTTLLAPSNTPKLEIARTASADGSSSHSPWPASPKVSKKATAVPASVWSEVLAPVGRG
jgi:hypothetical protein